MEVIQVALDPETGVRAGRREWIGLAVLALPTLLLSMDVSVLYLALPRLSADLHADAIQQLWILDIYSFMLSGFLVTMGSLGDRIGRRRLLLIGATAFGIASVLAAFSTSATMLIASRAVLGIAGATLAPSSLALLRNMFRDPKQLGSAIGLWFSCFMGGMLLGPLVGGTLLEHYWWGSAFLLGVPVMLLLIVVGPIVLPEYADREAGRIDLASVPLSLATILPIIFGLKELARNGLSLGAITAVAFGLAVGVVFVRRQLSLTSPIVDVRLFSDRSFNAAFGIMLLGGVVMAGISLMSAIYLQVVAGLTPFNAGLRLIPQNLAMVIGFSVAPVLARRFPARFVIAAGLLIGAVGLVVQTAVSPVDGVGTLVVGLVLAAFGISLPMALTLGVILSSSRPDRAGATASLFETGGQFGIALGVAALGSLGTMVYRAVVVGLLPADLPASASAGAHESLTAALDGVRSLPADVAAAVLRAGSEAFTSGLHVVAAVGSIVFIGLAAVAVRALQQAPIGPQPSDAREPVPTLAAAPEA
jgi:DHA2 family multidrug resistance protein-like MFS transporter